MNKKIIWNWLLCLFLPICYMQAQESHWSCNIYNYQYDMTLYPELQLDGSTVKASADYEVAAFCGDECRGVAEVDTVPGTDKTYYYLHIRSNATEGETITFKYYHTKTGEESVLNETLDFVSLSVTGYPSAPFALTGGSAVILGDVNGDNEIDVVDVIDLIDYILGAEPETFMSAAADVNSDGEVDVVDAIDLIDIILNN